AVKHRRVAHAAAQGLLILLLTYDAGVAGQRLLRIAQPVAVVHVHHIIGGEQARQVARTEGAGLPRAGIRAPVARAAAAVAQRDAGYDPDHDRTERLRQTVSEHAVGYVRHGGDVGIQRPVVIAADGCGIDPGNADVLLDDAVELIQGFGGVPGEEVLEGSSVFQVHGDR